MLLTRKLLAGGMPTRAVVNVASAGQAPLDLDDLQSTRQYDGVQAYRRSKLALIDFTFDLAEETKVAVNALHPGTFLDSRMVREAGVHPLGPVSRGADSIRHVLRRSLEGVSGRYFDEMEPALPDPQANDRAIRRGLTVRTVNSSRRSAAAHESGARLFVTPRSRGPRCYLHSGGIVRSIAMAVKTAGCRKECANLRRYWIMYALRRDGRRLTDCHIHCAG